MARWRTYQQRWTPIAVRATYPLGVAGAGLCVFGYVRYDNPSLPVALVLVVLFSAVITWGEWRGVKQGLYESELGLTCVHFYGSLVLPWDEIAAFEHRKAGTWDRVYARLRDGRFRPLPTVLQGQRVVWDGGETRDIVGVLNERLAELRSPHRAGPLETLNR
jgi:hypothetical protein